MKNTITTSAIIILGSFFILTIVYNFHIANRTKYESSGDAASFIELGTSLALHGKYGHLTSDSGTINAFQKNDVSKEELAFRGHSTWRPPIWPLLIAGIFLLFGYNLTYIIIFKFVLHFLGIFFFYKTLKLLKLREILVIIGAFLYGVSPTWQLYSRVFLSEPTTMFFITLWLYFLVKFVLNKSNFLPQAILGGILILSHPYYVFLPFSTWLVLLLKRQISFKLLIISSLVTVSIISVWVVRNFIVLDTNKIVLTTSSGAVMAKGWNRQVIEKHTNTKGDLANEGLVLQDYVYDKEKPRNEVQQMQLYQDATIHFIRTNSELIIPIIGKKLRSAFNPFPETPKPGFLEIGRWFFQLLSLLALIYLLLFSESKVVQSLAIGLILSTVAITIFTYSGFRFRMPQVGFELFLILYVLHEFWQKKISK